MRTKTCLAMLVLMNCGPAAFAAEPLPSGSAAGLLARSGTANSVSLLSGSGSSTPDWKLPPLDSGRFRPFIGLDLPGLKPPKFSELLEPMALIESLRHGTTPESRCDAAVKLGNLGSPEAINALSEAVRDSDSSVSDAAFKALGGISPYRAIWAKWRNYLVVAAIAVVALVVRKMK